MHIDREEHIRLLRAGFSDDLPLCSQRLSARCPGIICRFDTSRVVLQCRASKHFVGIERTARVGLVEANKRGLVQIRDSDITTGRTSVLVVNRRNVDECVVRTSGSADSLCEGTQSKVCGYD